MLFKGLQPILYGGREVWPLVEGGKGVSATNHASSGAWAAAGGIGTVSAVNADSYDAEGRIVPQVYNALTRRERVLLGPGGTFSRRSPSFAGAQQCGVATNFYAESSPSLPNYIAMTSGSTQGISDPK